MNKRAVLKFGGSSLANAEKLSTVCQIIETERKRFSAVYIVFSAFGGVTNALDALAQKASTGNANWDEDLQPVLAYNRGDVQAAQKVCLHEEEVTMEKFRVDELLSRSIGRL